MAVLWVVRKVQLIKRLEILDFEIWFEIKTRHYIGSTDS